MNSLTFPINSLVLLGGFKASEVTHLIELAEVEMRK